MLLGRNGKPKMLQLCAVGFTVEKLLLPLIDEMSKYYDVTVCMSYDGATDHLKARGYDVRNITIDRKISPFKNLKSVIRLFKLMRTEQYSVVHVHTPVAGILGRIAAKLARVPVIIYTAHGFYFHDNMPMLKKNLFIAIERLGGWLSDFIFTQSEEDYHTAVEKKIVSKEKITVIGNGIDIRRFSADTISPEQKQSLTDQFKLGPDEVCIGIIGRVVKEKGYLEWVKAGKVLLDSGCRVKFIAVGDTLESDRDGIKDEIDTYLQSNNISEHFIFTGSRTDIPELLAIMDIFTLPSYREGMPRSIIEAMSMQKPVIATNIRGCREEIIEGETGYLVSVGDAKQLSDRMLKLVRDPQLRKDMGVKARRRAENEFDENLVLKKQVSVINKLCGLISNQDSI